MDAIAILLNAFIGLFCRLMWMWGVSSFK